MACYLESLIRLVYPAQCGICQNFLAIEEQGICLGCLTRLRERQFELENALVDQKFNYLDEGWSLYPYESPLKDMLTAIKFLRKRWLMKVFQEEIKDLAVSLASENPYDFLIPIPLDRQKYVDREFNQSELIARLLSRHTNLPIKTRFLYKRHSTPAQGLLSKMERQINLFGAFGVRQPEKISGNSFLLVDDIFTTGATAEEAAKTLKQYGAKRVGLFALARTQLKESL